jgi:four helix bundle protein
MSGGYRDLVAWQRAMDLAVSCYAVGMSLRRARHGSLASQLQRAAISVPANIAEGKGRGTKREYARFLTVALGSLREVETLIQLALRIGAAKDSSCSAILQLADEVGRVTFGLKRALLMPDGKPAA